MKSNNDKGMDRQQVLSFIKVKSDNSRKKNRKATGLELLMNETSITVRKEKMKSKV